MDITSFHFSDHTPYPPVEAEGKNPRYAAAILSNIGACNSEMSAVSLYFYNSLITREYYQDIAECFHRISLVEMHHLSIFGELALKLGTDPRLWSYDKRRMNYWSPACNQYPSHITELLANSLAGETRAIRKYQDQSQWIEDSHIKAILKRIIADEELHVKIFRFLLSGLSASEQVLAESLDTTAPAKSPDTAAVESSDTAALPAI